MKATTATLTDLLERVPRRHSADNVKEINTLVSEYEEILITIEALNLKTWTRLEQLSKSRLIIKLQRKAKTIIFLKPPVY